MIKRLKTAVFNRKETIKSKKTTEIHQVIVKSEESKNLLSNFNMKIEKENVDKNRELDVDKVLSKLDSLSGIAKDTKEIESNPIMEVTKGIGKDIPEPVNINKKIEGLENSLSQKYESIGYTSEDARTIVELQEMNKNLLAIGDIVNQQVDMAYVYQMWFNELVIEELNSESIDSQTLILLSFNLVNVEKIRQTKTVLDILSEDRNIYSTRKLKAMDLYFEKELIKLATGIIDDSDTLIVKLNKKIDVLISTNLKYNTMQSELITDSCKSCVKRIASKLPQKVLVNSCANHLKSSAYLNELSKAVLNSIELGALVDIKENRSIAKIEVNYSNELVEFSDISNIQDVLYRLKSDIDKYGLDYFTTEYILQKYIESGLSEIDAKLLIELQEKNFNKLDIRTVIESDIPSSFIKNLWFNEIVNELLFKFKMEDQALMLIRYNLVDKVKLSETQIVLDDILFGRASISEFDLRKMDLFFEDELVEMLSCNIELKEQYYSVLHDNIMLLKKSLSTEKHTLESTGSLYGITRERVRQIDKRIITRLSMLSETYKKHLNENFLLGLDSLALSVLGHKPIKEIEYFTNGIVKPTQYFINKYKLTDNYYVYNGKVLQKQNKALFEEYMSTYDNKQYSAQEILNDFVETLKAANIYEDVMKNNEVDLREIQGRLSRMENIIHAGQYYRKHNIKSSEIEELIVRIEEKELPNAFSAKLLLTKEIINGLDILDENELHNILKRNNMYFKEDIQFSRMPHMTIGKADIAEELYRMVDIELLSSNPENALAELSEITGIKEQTLAGSYYQKIVNLVPNDELAVEGLTELEMKLSNIDTDVVHIEVLSEKYNISLSNKFKDLLKVKAVNGFKLRSNWLIKEPYKSISNYIEKNVDDYSIFNESRLGASKFVHNYTTMRKSLRAKNIFRLNSNELYFITDKELINEIEALKDDILFELKFPYSLEAILESEKFETIVENHNLDKYGFGLLFWEDVLMSIEDLRLDANIVVNKNQPIEYSDYIEGFVCSIYDYEEGFKEVIGCEPPPKYVRKLEEEGVFIKDDIIYMEKEIYLNELRSVA